MATTSSSAATSAGLMQCEDFMQFENALRQSRDIDDKIIQALNNSIPTASFRGHVDISEQCKDLWQNIEATYAKRETAINRCISHSEVRLGSLKAVGDKSSIRQAQVTLRMLKSELYVEGVVRNRTQKAFNEKCRDHFKPPSTEAKSS